MEQTQRYANMWHARSSPISERPGGERSALAEVSDAAVRVGAAAAMPKSHLDVAVRRSRATDLEGFETFVAGLSMATSTRRFFTPTPRLARPQARLLIANDRTRGCFLALDGEQVIAHGCWVAVGPGVAEIAMVVADGVQRRGVGRRLMRALLRDLCDAGMGRMEMVVQPDNRGVVDLITRAWPDARVRAEDGLLTFVTPTAAEAEVRAVA